MLLIARLKLQRKPVPAELAHELTQQLFKRNSVINPKPRASLDLARHYYHGARRVTDQLVISQAEHYVLAAEGRWEEAWRSFEAAIEEHGKMEQPLARARILVGWAEMQIVRGGIDDLNRANELLVEARAEFEAMGASGYVDRVDARIMEMPKSPS